MPSNPPAPAVPAQDTIVAIATPPGRGGLGVLRLSGPQALSFTKPLLAGLREEPAPGQARFALLAEPATGQKLDEAVVTWFQAPRSYTGEDVVEISAHGSPVLLDHLLRLLLAAGARLAAPGEFTERAFLSGRIDLTQAEAVRDLIDAQTLLQAQTAAQQLGGALSRAVRPLKDVLLALIAQLEAGIDFAEDDTPVVEESSLLAALAQLEAALATLEASFAQGRLIVQGTTLALVGRPNAGKSSLFNRLLGRERAIVTAEPGTTRDTVGERLSIGGVPVELIDTAGLREAAGEAERIGIMHSREAFADAGLVLLVLDCTELTAGTLNSEEAALLLSASGRPLLVALNKSDRAVAPQALREAVEQVHTLVPSALVLQTSALTGEGIAELRIAMERLLRGESGAAPESALLTNLRQHTAVEAAHAAIRAAQAAAAHAVPHEMILLDLYAVLRELDALTGATTNEDVLSLIFSTFCIGK